MTASPGHDEDDELYTRRKYLLMKAVQAGSAWPVAIEAVSSLALSHPEWDMEEAKTYADWEKR